MAEDHAAKAREFLASAGEYEGESRTGDLLASIAHSLVVLVERTEHLVMPQRYVLNDSWDPADTDAFKSMRKQGGTA